MSWIGLNQTDPIRAAALITPNCPQAFGHAMTMQVVVTAIEILAVSVHRFRAMPHTAWATSATATTFKPCIALAGKAPK